MAKKLLKKRNLKNHKFSKHNTHHGRFLEIVVILSAAMLGAYFLEGITGAVVGVGDSIVEADVMEQIRQDGEASVIIVLKEGQTSTIQEKVLDDLQPEKTIFGTRQEEKFELDQQYATVNALAGTVTEAGLKELDNNPYVEKVVPNEVRRIFLADSASLVGAASVWNMTVNGTTIDGSGETVCVIDTGVDYTNPALGGCSSADFLAGSCSKVINGHDFVNDDNDPLDDNGHGTHVAGIIASSDSMYRGIAPNAKIVAMKVCNLDGSCEDADVLAGIDWCIANTITYNISVISISLGSDQFNSYCDQTAGIAYASMINQAVANNISIVFSTGNTYGSYTNPTAGISVPACVFNATRVSATDKSDNIPGYAFRNENFSDILLAPGSSITSLKNGGGTRTLSGTSMSTPHVSAAIALLQQFSKLHYGRMLTPREGKDWLNSTGKKINDASSGIFFPRIAVNVAIASHDSAAPVVSFLLPTPTNNAKVTTNNITINISSSEVLQTAVLEWNGVNESMQNDGLQFFATKTGLAGGQYSYAVHGTDLSNSTNSTETRMIMIESKPVISSIIANNSYVSSSASLNVTITNDVQLSASSYNLSNAAGVIVKSSSTADILQTSYAWNILPDAAIADGAYVLTIFANNTAGDSSVSIVSFIIDGTVPRFTDIIISPMVIYSSSTVLLSVKVLENNPNASAVIFESNFTGTWQQYAMTNQDNIYNFTIAGKSNLRPYTEIGYKFKAIDVVGNSNSTETMVMVVQNQVPSVTITSPQNNSLFELGSAATFIAQASDGDNDTISYLWNFGGATSSGNSVSYTYTSTGAFIAAVAANDLYNASAASLTIRVNDTLPPAITSLNYDTEVHLEQDNNMPLTVVVTDYSGLSNVTVYLNNAALNDSCSKTNSSWSCNWLIDGLAVGTSSLTVYAVDNFIQKHNLSSTTTFSVTSCSDGTQNGNEDGLDCGGACPNSCTGAASDGTSAGADAGATSSDGDSGSTSESSNSESAAESAAESFSKESSSGESSSDESSASEAAQELSVNSDNLAEENTSAVSFGNRLTGLFSALVPDSFGKKTVGLIGLGILSLILLVAYFVLINREEAVL